MDSSIDNDLILYESCDFYYYKKDMCNDVYFNKLNKYISLGESDNFYCWLDESYELTTSFTVFEFLRHSEFKYFFSTSMVDIPQCFNSSKSLRRSINKTPLIRFNNYLMRDGKRLKSMNLFLSVIWNIYFNEKNTLSSSSVTSWRSIYTSLSNVSTNKKHTVYPTNFFLKDFFGYDISTFGKHSNDETIYQKYEQIRKLGGNVYLYTGGLFEWILLQDIYGFSQFPTNPKIKTLDLLKYKPPTLLNTKYLTYSWQADC